MSVWGVNLYQNDVACDIQTDYLNWLRVSESNEEATKNLISSNEEIINDEDDGPLFWFALADTQWKYGRLLPEVKKIALKYINEGVDLKRWENTTDYNKRKKILEELEIRLNSKQPLEKKVSKLKLSKSLWDVGDVLLYQLRDSDLNSKWNNKYILLKVIGKIKKNIGSLPVHKYANEYSILGLYNWVGNNEPDLKVIKDLRLLIKKDFWGNEVEDICCLSFSSLQLKRLKFKVFKKNTKKEDKFFDRLGTVVNIYNIDSVFIDVLIDAEEQNNLMNDDI